MASPRTRHRDSDKTIQASSIIKLDHFILATRDSGYKGTTSAIAELVDNALQAGAQQVHIWIAKDPESEVHPLMIGVQDDGDGMDAPTLRQALRFGGTTRFNDRSGTGRYGMGLPNSSLSQARRVLVHTWRRPSPILMTYLDVDEIASGKMTEVPEPRVSDLPDWCPPLASKTGTLVVWQRCDRLDNRRVSTLANKIEDFLGRVFRYRLWKDLKLTVNGSRVRPRDPLFLRAGTTPAAAKLFGDVMEYELQSMTSNRSGGPTGKVWVRFSELPIQDWHDLSNSEKRDLGVVDQPIVSVVRGDREIDRGWFFMGGKRRENYDDWWRCEVRFDPVLDEWFGITHTKQQVRPVQELLGVLANDLETQARALNLRVRAAHQGLKLRSQTAASEQRASDREQVLAPLPRPNERERKAFGSAVAHHPTLKKWSADPVDPKSARRFAIVDGTPDRDIFFDVIRDTGRLAVILNRGHLFFRRVYAPLVESDRLEDKALKASLELLLLAAARAESVLVGTNARAVLKRFRREWSTVLAAYLRA